MRALAVLALLAAAAAVPVQHGRRGRQGRAAAAKADAGVASFVLENDVNIVHLTDVHSWLSGHLHEPADEADYPDVLAFFQQLEAMAHAQGKDLFLFNSGDIVDGTGLAGATAIDGQGILPIIRQMPFAAITCGNHELYIDSTIGNMVQSGFIDSWKGRYIQGNIRNSTTNALLGTPYAHIAGAMGTELVVLGFLYNMWDSCKSVTVQHVELAVKEPWFAEAMAAASDAKVSAIVVLAHMHVEDHLVSVLLKAIRATNKLKSVIFLTGHTHIRAYAALDPRAISMESGKYLDTVGLLGCSTTAEGLSCEHEFVTPHKPTFYNMTSTTATTFQTPASLAMRNDIAKLRAKMSLDTVIGCSDRDYNPFVPIDLPTSLWKLFMYQVAPAEVPLPSQKHFVFVGSTGSFRWTLFAGNVSIDDTYVVNPFKDPFEATLQIPGPVLAVALKALISKKTGPLRTADAALRAADLPHYVSSVAPEDLDASVTYDLAWFQFDTPVVSAALKKANGGVAFPVKPFRQGEIDSRSVFESYIRREWPCPRAAS
eukprot:Tamp_08450.p1 GENE.Tamp_08450~~Tamp_08450.p1  ORF type:complete len:541 (-),score=151.44 Tamp_08450:702-2324(-)